MKKHSFFLNFLLLSTILLSGCGSDSQDDIDQTQKKLKLISQAIKLFKSESYFGKAPSNLEDLYHYQTTYYNVPQQNTLYTEEKVNTDQKKFVEKTDTFSLINNPRVFLKSGRDKEDEDELLAPGKFVSDFDFLSNYQQFLPDNTIIAWDKAGNFKTGGNILFENGQVTFLKASPEEYRRFTIGLKTQTDRDFIRDICIRNNTDCSLANIAQQAQK